jgi:hypothetical protein
MAVGKAVCWEVCVVVGKVGKMVFDWDGTKAAEWAACLGRRWVEPSERSSVGE